MGLGIVIPLPFTKQHLFSKFLVWEGGQKLAVVDLTASWNSCNGQALFWVFCASISSCSVRIAISLTFFVLATQERLLLLLLQRLLAFHSLVYGLRLLLPLGSAAFSEAVNLLPLLLPSQVTFQPAGPKVDNSREAFDQAEEAA